MSGTDDAELEANDSQWKGKVEATTILVQAVQSAVQYFRSAKASGDRYTENRQKH